MLKEVFRNLQISAADLQRAHSLKSFGHQNNFVDVFCLMSKKSLFFLDIKPKLDLSLWTLFLKDSDI